MDKWDRHGFVIPYITGRDAIHIAFTSVVSYSTVRKVQLTRNCWGPEICFPGTSMAGFFTAY